MVSDEKTGASSIHGHVSARRRYIIWLGDPRVYGKDHTLSSGHVGLRHWGHGVVR